jgi:hypothetical protein
MFASDNENIMTRSIRGKTVSNQSLNENNEKTDASDYARTHDTKGTFALL